MDHHFSPWTFFLKSQKDCLHRFIIEVNRKHVRRPYIIRIEKAYSGKVIEIY